MFTTCSAAACDASGGSISKIECPIRSMYIFSAHSPSFLRSFQIIKDLSTASRSTLGDGSTTPFYNLLDITNTLWNVDNATGIVSLRPDYAAAWAAVLPDYTEVGFTPPPTPLSRFPSTTCRAQKARPHASFDATQVPPRNSLRSCWPHHFSLARSRARSLSTLFVLLPFLWTQKRKHAAPLTPIIIGTLTSGHVQAYNASAIVGFFLGDELVGRGQSPFRPPTASYPIPHQPHTPSIGTSKMPTFWDTALLLLHVYMLACTSRASRAPSVLKVWTLQITRRLHQP